MSHQTESQAVRFLERMKAYPNKPTALELNVNQITPYRVEHTPIHRFKVNRSTGSTSSASSFQHLGKVFSNTSSSSGPS